MYRQAYDEVVELGEQVRRRDKLRRQLAVARAELADLQREHDELAQGLSKEERDVEKLEGPSLTRLLLSVVGGVEQRLDKERKEALQARLLVRAKRSEVDLTQAEIERLEQQLGPLENVDARYARAFEDKVNRVLEAGGETAEHVTKLIEEVSSASQLIREIDEALEAGKWAERHLTEALRDIGTLEEEQAAMIAALTVTTVVTVTMSSPMPTAHRLEENLKQAHGWIRRYARELEDVPGSAYAVAKTATEANLLLSFVNIVGGAATEAATRAKDAVRSCLAHVRHIQSGLEATRNEATTRYADAMARYQQSVTRA